MIQPGWEASSLLSLGHVLANLSCCAYGLRNPFIYNVVDYSSSSSIGKRLGGTAMWSTVEGDCGEGRGVHGQGGECWEGPGT